MLLALAATFLLVPSRAFLVQVHPFRVTVTVTSSCSCHRMLSLSVADSMTGKPLVTVGEALKAFEDRSVVFVDGSWFLSGRNGRAEYETGPRIQGAVYFDIDDVASKGDCNPRNIKHMMPPKRLFAAAMDAMGIQNSNHLIVYGTKGCMTTHRAWYQLSAMGHAKELVHLMQGSLDDWMTLGGPIDKAPAKAIEADTLDLDKEPDYVATDPQNVVDLEEMKEIVDGHSAIVIDVRARNRFLGQVEEPRPGLRLGHMPGAVNLPFTNLLVPDSSTFKSKEEMATLIQEAGIDINTDKRIVVSCGSGVTACVVATALQVCGRDFHNTYVYDGSWMEWGGQADTPIVKNE